MLALDLRSGEELGAEAVAYTHGVIDAVLPGSDVRLAADWALQDPADWLRVVRTGVPAALESGGIDPARVVGLGIDCTSCTVLPTLADGTPLSELTELSGRPHAWAKLWKHHAAQPVADRMNAVAAERGEPFLARYGGRISSEWYFPKLIEIFEQDRPVYDAAAVFVEATDWIVWQLTGNLVRSACPAGYKALWSADDGLPADGYFAAVSPGFLAPSSRLGTSFAPLGSSAGSLHPDLAAELGLDEHVAVAVGNVDSFVSVPGCGVVEPGVLVSVVGTSICDMLVDDAEVLLPGITGVIARRHRAGPLRLRGRSAGRRRRLRLVPRPPARCRVAGCAGPAGRVGQRRSAGLRRGRARRVAPPPGGERPRRPRLVERQPQRARRRRPLRCRCRSHAADHTRGAVQGAARVRRLRRAARSSTTSSSMGSPCGASSPAAGSPRNRRS